MDDKHLDDGAERIQKRHLKRSRSRYLITFLPKVYVSLDKQMTDAFLEFAGNE